MSKLIRLVLAAAAAAVVPACGGGGGGGGAPAPTAGGLDGTFGNAGFILSNPGDMGDAATAIASDSGFAYLAGFGTGSTDGKYWRIEKRSLADGTLAWVRTSDPTVLDDEAAAVAIDSTYLYVAGWTAVGGDAALRIEKRLLSTGDLETTTFGGGAGFVASNPTGAIDLARAIAIDTTYMYVAGTSAGAWYVEKRLLSDGSPSGAPWSVDPTAGVDTARAIVVNSTTAFIAGAQDTSGDSAWRIEARSLSDGSIDWASSLPLSAGADEAHAIAIDATHLYVAGFDSSPGNTQWRIEKRAQSTGFGEPAFGSFGIVMFNPSSGADSAETLAMDSTGLYVGGHGSGAWRLEKRDLTSGGLIGAFGVSGVVTSDPSIYIEVLTGLAVDGSAVYAAGFDLQCGVPGNTQWRLEKRSPSDGALDGAFGTPGVLTVDPTSDDAVAAVAIDATSLYIVGSDRLGGDRQWRIEKRSLADGTLDGGFGPSGIVKVNPGGDSDEARAIAIDATYMYVAGMDDVPGDGQWRIEKRSLATGALAYAVTDNPSGGFDETRAIAIDSTYMYVGGFDMATGDEQWRIEKRSLATGALETTTFGGGTGIVTVEPSVGPDSIVAIAVDSTSIYAAGYDNAGSSQQWRIQKFDKATGVTLAGFGLAGVVQVDPSSFSDTVMGMIIDATSMYVAGTYQTGSTGTGWRIEKRSLADGSLDVGFGSGGVVSTDPSAGDDVPSSLALDSAALYVFGSDASGWRIEKRSASDGGLLGDFGSGGVISQPAATGSASAVAVDATRLYVAGTDFGGTGIPTRWRVEKRTK